MVEFVQSYNDRLLTKEELDDMKNGEFDFIKEQVIRCKDCKFLESLYMSEIDGSWFPDGVGICNKWNNFDCQIDGFCAWGELDG